MNIFPAERAERSRMSTALRVPAVLALLLGTLLGLQSVLAEKATWNARVSIERTTGAKPLGKGWRQCFQVEIANPTDFEGVWAGVLHLSGGRIAKSDDAAASRADNLAKLVEGDGSVYRLDAGGKPDSALLGRRGKARLGEWCVDYRESWSVRPEIWIQAVDADLVEVSAEPVGEVVMRKFAKRQSGGGFSADWSRGYCQCLPTARALPPASASATGTVATTETGTQSLAQTTTTNQVFDQPPPAAPTTTVAPAPPPPPPPPSSTTVAPAPLAITTTQVVVPAVTSTTRPRSTTTTPAFSPPPKNPLNPRHDDGTPWLDDVDDNTADDDNGDCDNPTPVIRGGCGPVTKRQKVGISVQKDGDVEKFLDEVTTKLGDGKFRYRVPELVDGDYDVRFKCSNGTIKYRVRMRRSASKPPVQDTRFEPLIEQVSGRDLNKPNCSTNDSIPSLRGHSEPGSTVTLWYKNDDDSSASPIQGDSRTCDNDGAFELKPPNLPYGRWRVYIAHRDWGSCEYQVNVNRTYVYDANAEKPDPPNIESVSGDSSSAPVAYQKRPSFIGVAEPLSQSVNVSFYIATSSAFPTPVFVGSAMTKKGSGKWNYTHTADLADGSYIFYAKSAAGQTQQTFTVSAKPPGAITVYSVNGNWGSTTSMGSISSKTVSIYGRCAKSGQTGMVYVNGTVADRELTGIIETFTLGVNFTTKGTYSMYVVCADSRGTESPKVVIGGSNGLVRIGYNSD